MNRFTIKKSFDIDGFKFYVTKKGTYRKAKLCTNAKSQIISEDEFTAAWNKYFDLYYA